MLKAVLIKTTATMAEGPAFDRSRSLAIYVRGQMDALMRVLSEIIGDSKGAVTVAEMDIEDVRINLKSANSYFCCRLYTTVGKTYNTLNGMEWRILFGISPDAPDEDSGGGPANTSEADK